MNKVQQVLDVYDYHYTNGRLNLGSALEQLRQLYPNQWTGNDVIQKAYISKIGTRYRNGELNKPCASKVLEPKSWNPNTKINFSLETIIKLKSLVNEVGGTDNLESLLNVLK